MLRNERFKPFVFLIPVLNPASGFVKDYRVIENNLRATLESISAIEAANIHVVVVCHRPPDYLEALPENVIFIDISQCGRASELITSRENNSEAVQRARCAGARMPNRYKPSLLDKGFKMLIGVSYALRFIDPEFIMPMDADDFISSSLVETARGHRGKIDQGYDGFYLSKGLEVELSGKGIDLEIKRVYRVKKFNRTCGSCRILYFPSIMKSVLAETDFQSFTSECWGSEPGIQTVRPNPDAVHSLYQEICKRHFEADAITNLLGRHTHQVGYLTLFALQMDLAAKACGHGNHVGRSGGKIHRDNVIAVVDDAKFLDDLGLNGILRSCQHTGIQFEKREVSHFRRLFNRLPFRDLESFKVFVRSHGAY